ncbi:hypothetical protein P7K49_003127 [Saguinus oedipus]|uniref:BH3-interacting domain death agonist n=1 Tax=Saguinus oedipus TaxID=9490 RepID=A0ABQ9WJA6_SAGOE|nr:hypothetical protein P7K49_003127 [Saguinus oedipus]
MKQMRGRKGLHLLETQPGKVSNGSGLRDERITNLLVFGFLQSCSNHSFHGELEALGRELPQWEKPDEELQTDGNRSSHSHVGRIEAACSSTPLAKGLLLQTGAVPSRGWGVWWLTHFHIQPCNAGFQ